MAARGAVLGAGMGAPPPGLAVTGAAAFARTLSTGCGQMFHAPDGGLGAAAVVVRNVRR
jgi:hypothetical protein